MITLVGEVAELKTKSDRPAVGTVIEAELDKSRGPAASLLVQHGTLKVGDSIVVGNTFGKVDRFSSSRMTRQHAASVKPGLK